MPGTTRRFQWIAGDLHVRKKIMISAVTRLLSLIALQWCIFLSVLIFHMSLAGFEHYSHGKPLPGLSYFLITGYLPFSLIPSLWLLFLIVSWFSLRLKAIVEHNLFLTSYLSCAFAVVTTLCAAAAMPWIPNYS